MKFLIKLSITEVILFLFSDIIDYSGLRVGRYIDKYGILPLLEDENLVYVYCKELGLWDFYQ